MAEKSGLMMFRGSKKRVAIDKKDIEGAGGLEKEFKAKYGDTGKEKKKKIVYKVSKEDFFDTKMKPLKGETKYFTGTRADDKPLPSAEGASGYEGADPNIYHYKKYRRARRAGKAFELVAKGASAVGAAGIAAATGSSFFKSKK